MLAWGARWLALPDLGNRDGALRARFGGRRRRGSPPPHPPSTTTTAATIAPRFAIFTSFWLDDVAVPVKSRSAGGPTHRATAEHMKVQVEDALSAVGAGVDDHPVSGREEPRFLRHTASPQHQLA